MRNRTKVMLLIMAFWIGLQTSLLLIGFSPLLVLMFSILGITISNLICTYLDNEWFDSTDFFKK